MQPCDAACGHCPDLRRACVSEALHCISRHRFVAALRTAPPPVVQFVTRTVNRPYVSGALMAPRMRWDSDPPPPPSASPGQGGAVVM